MNPQEIEGKASEQRGGDDKTGGGGILKTG